MKKQSFLYAPAIFWLALVTFLLSLPGSEFPKITWFSRIWADKWVHIFLFFVLIVIWCRAIANTSAAISFKKNFRRIVLLGIAYGIAMEFVQHFFIRFRGFEWGDIIANTLGAGAGYWFSAKSYIKK